MKELMGLILYSELEWGEKADFQIIFDIENSGLFILCNQQHMLWLSAINGV